MNEFSTEARVGDFSGICRRKPLSRIGFGVEPIRGILFLPESKPQQYID